MITNTDFLAKNYWLKSAIKFKAPLVYFNKLRMAVGRGYILTVSVKSSIGHDNYIRTIIF